MRIVPDLHMRFNIPLDQRGMGKRFAGVLDIAIGVIVKEDDGPSCTEKVDEMLDFPLALVLKHPIVGRNINLLSCLNVSKELPGAQSFLMTKAMAMGADCALEVFHRAVGKTTEVYPFAFKDFESLPDALHTGGSHRPRKRHGYSSMRIKWGKSFILPFAGHVENLGIGIFLEDVLCLGSLVFDYYHNKKLTGYFIDYKYTGKRGARLVINLFYDFISILGTMRGCYIMPKRWIL